MMMKKAIVVALACVLITTPVFAGQVPGTSVTMTPPSGFVPADRFNGFMNETTGSTIMISEMPGPFQEVTAGFSNPKSMQAKGMKLLNRSMTRVDGHTAMLVHAEQPAYGQMFRKWVVAVDRSGATTLIVANYPKAAAGYQEEILKTAILAATFVEPTDPADTLAFTVEPVEPFKVAKVMGQNMVLSPGGQFPLKDESVPYMVLGLSASGNLARSGQKAFAEHRVTSIATIRNVSVNQTTPVVIGGMSGYTTEAKGEEENTSTPLTIYQVILFDTSGYSVIQGITPSVNKSTYMPIFEKIAITFKMKK